MLAPSTGRCQQRQWQFRTACDILNRHTYVLLSHKAAAKSLLPDNNNQSSRQWVEQRSSLILKNTMKLIWISKTARSTSEMINSGFLCALNRCVANCHVTGMVQCARGRACVTPRVCVCVCARARVRSVIFRVVLVAGGSLSASAASWHSCWGGEVKFDRLSVSVCPSVCLRERETEREAAN